MAEIKDEKELFELMGIPLQWKMKASQLKHSADIIWIETEIWGAKFNKWFKKEKKGKKTAIKIEPTVFHVYEMLAGFTIENLFKGIIIIEHPEYLKNGKMDTIIKSHDLLELATLAKITLTTNEKVFCENATEAILTSGRYPIPTYAKHIKTSYTLGGHIREVFEGLYNRLYILIPPRDFPKRIPNKSKSIIKRLLFSAITRNSIKDFYFYQ